MVSTVDVLRVARDLYAQAPSHAPYPQAPREGTYCIMTALHAAGPLMIAVRADATLRRVTCADGLVEFNATHSTEEVLAAFDQAIEAEALKVAG